MHFGIKNAKKKTDQKEVNCTTETHNTKGDLVHSQDQLLFVQIEVHRLVYTK